MASEYLALFQKLARHLPGLGGLASYDALDESEALELARLVTADLEREAEAVRSAGRR